MASTTDSQPVAPILAASNSTPPLPPDSPHARPVSTIELSTAATPTVGYSLDQLQALERGRDSQPVAPILAASNSTPPLPPDTPHARPVSTIELSTAATPTVGYSLDQLQALERGRTARPIPRRSGTMGTFVTSLSAGGSIAQTEYTDMVFESIPFWINSITNLFLWIVLAGFLVLPSSFPNIPPGWQSNEANDLRKALRIARNIPLLAIGFTCCGIGSVGLCCVWGAYSHNTVWLLSSIFIPGMFGGLSGLISTFVNLYGSGKTVHYGTTTIATIAAIGGYTAICGLLTIIYTIKKHLVKRRHHRISREISDSGDEKLKP